MECKRSKWGCRIAQLKVDNVLHEQISVIGLNHYMIFQYSSFPLHLWKLGIPGSIRFVYTDWISNMQCSIKKHIFLPTKQLNDIGYWKEVKCTSISLSVGFPVSFFFLEWLNKNKHHSIHWRDLDKARTTNQNGKILTTVDPHVIAHPRNKLFLHHLTKFYSKLKKIKVLQYEWTIYLQH